jgi:plasmid stabilization system protein ParE
MAKVLVSSAAEGDYADALCWYAERSVQVAEQFEAEFAATLDTIGSDPERFPLLDDRHRYYLMRRYPFQVIFRLHGEDVLVIAVAHAKRKPLYWADR